MMLKLKPSWAWVLIVVAAIICAVMLMPRLSHAQGTYREINLIPLGTTTATGNGATINSDFNGIGYDMPDTRVYVNVTAVSGTSPTMTVNFQSTVNGAVYTIASSASITAVGTYTFIVQDQMATNVRLGYVIGGTTPSFTWEGWMVKH